MRDVIETPRLILRPLTAADAPAMERFCGDWDVARMLRVVPWPYPPGMAQGYIRRVLAAEGGERAWAVCHRDEPVELRGVVSTAPEDGEGAFRIGYWIGKPWWGMGLMTEAVAALCDVLIEGGATALTAGVFTDNARSARLLEKIGFTFGAAPVAWNEARGEDVPYRRCLLTPAARDAARDASARQAPASAAE